MEVHSLSEAAKYVGKKCPFKLSDKVVVERNGDQQIFAYQFMSEVLGRNVATYLPRLKVVELHTQNGAMGRIYSVPINEIELLR